MVFPLDMNGRTFSSPQELGAYALAQAETPSDDEACPSRWLPSLATEGKLNAQDVMGLIAGMLRVPRAGAVAEASRAAAAMDDAELARLLRLALQGHDVSLLLSPDPHRAGHSVEDALLEALAELAHLLESREVSGLLDSLSHAGLSREELSVLLRCGEPEQIAQRLPSILAEGLPEGAEQAIFAGMERDPEVASAIRTSLEGLGLHQLEGVLESS